jgi:hydroxysqualene synthase
VKTDDKRLSQAYNFCQQLAKSHYENFPVASILLPKRLRQPISVIYAFSRTADDFADEGGATNTERLHQLDIYSHALLQIGEESYQGTDPIFIALADVIHRHDLPVHLFQDLLSAFKQDVVKSRYANFEEVLDYCTRSANPIGRLLLHLDGNPSHHQLEQSDNVCTALQLINFYQDILQDYAEQNRIYIPQNELASSGLVESDLVQENSHKIAPLIRSLYQRTEEIMAKGNPLGAALSGRMGWEVRAMTLGGIQTLALLKKQRDVELLTRPRLGKGLMIRVLLWSLFKSLYLNKAKKLLEVLPA